MPNRADVTLLVGRAIRCDCFPLAWAEIKQASFLDPCLAYGKDYACPYPVGVFLVGEKAGVQVPLVPGQETGDQETGHATPEPLYAPLIHSKMVAEV